jgi:hypothetical protein
MCCYVIWRILQCNRTGWFLRWVEGPHKPHADHCDCSSCHSSGQPRCDHFRSPQDGLLHSHSYFSLTPAFQPAAPRRTLCIDWHIFSVTICSAVHATRSCSFYENHFQPLILCSGPPMVRRFHPRLLIWPFRLVLLLLHQTSYPNDCCCPKWRCSLSPVQCVPA